MASDDRGRHVVPIPDRPYTGLITYDAKDPLTSFPPIEPVSPPEGGPNARDNGFDGDIRWLQIDLEPDDHSHMIDTDHMAHVRLVKQ